MKLRFGFFYFFFFLLISCTLQSQPSPLFLSDHEILGLAVNPDKTKIACFDINNIYILDYNSLKLVVKWEHHVWIPEYTDIEKINKLSSFYFNPTKPDQLISRIRFDLPLGSYHYECPADSIIVWDSKEGTVVNKFPGNTFLSVNRSNFIIGQNQYRSFTDKYGMGYFYPRGGEILSFPRKVSVTYKNALRNIISNPSGSQIAMAFFDSTYEDKDLFSIEIREPDSLKLLRRLGNLTSLPELLTYSKTGKYLAYKTILEETGKKAVVLLDTAALTQKVIFTDFEGDDWYATNIKYFDFSDDDSFLQVLFDQTIYFYNINSGMLNYRLSSDLTSGSMINGFRLENDSVILVCGLKDFDGRTGYVERINFKQLGIFTVVSRDTTYQIYDPAETRIQINDFIKDPSDLHWSADGRTFSFTRGNVLEIWDAATRKKKYIHSFEKEIRAFPDASGKFILVFQDAVPFDKIHLLNIGSGVITSKAFTDENFSISYADRCVPDKTIDSTWFYADWDGRNLWKYNCTRNTFDKWMEFQQDSLFGFRQVPGDEKWVIGIKKNREYLLLMADLNKKIITDTIVSGNRIIPFDISGENKLLFADSKNNLFLFEMGQQKRSKIMALTAGREIKSISGSPDNNQVLVEFSILKHKKQYDSCAWIDVSQKRIIATFEKDYGTYKPVGNGEVALLGMEGIISFKPGQRAVNEWTIKDRQAFAGVNLGVDDSGRYLLSYDDLIDLGTGRSVNTFKDCRYSAKTLIPGSDPLSAAHVYSGEYSDTSDFYGIKIINAFNNRVLATTREPINKKKMIYGWGWSAIYSSPKGNWIFCPASDYKPAPSAIWHLPGMEKTTLDENGEFYPRYFAFSPAEDRLYIFFEKLFMSENDSSERISLPGGKSDRKFPFKIDAAGDSEEELFSIYLGNINLLKIDKSVPEIKQTYCSGTRLSCMFYDQEKQRIFGGAYSGRIFCWNRNRPVTPEYILEGGTSEVIQLLLRSQRLYAYFRNGDLQIWDLVSRKLVIQMKVLDIKENPHYFYNTAEGYYMGEKNILNYLHFVKWGNTFPFSQFDLRYNRPDIVLERIGYASKDLIESYRKAYYKRLKKMNFDESMFSPEFHTPEIQIMNTDNILQTSDFRLQTLKIKATDSKYNLDRINFWVNDVPAYGMNGLSLRRQKRGSVVMDIPVTLSQGENKIQVSCLNEKGVESLRESINIRYEPAKPEKSDVYFVGIGVSDYNDPRLNLNYAVKDIRDLAVLFKNKNPDLITDTLMNRSVTRQNVLGLKEKLLKTRIDDEVILAISGHGFLSDSLDFYYGTSDIDYKHPEVNGLSYDDIEWLMDSIPARKKLVFMDACHSGEVDREVKENKGGVQLAENVKASDRKGVEAEVDSTSIGLQNSFELMQELFTNLSKGNGAVVISAAGGLEYAYEGPDWKNGVFTYSLRKGLADQEADQDKNGTITVNELKDYLYKQVETLTKGKQKPTSRQEMLENDWKIW